MTNQTKRVFFRPLALAALMAAGMAGQVQAATTWTENFGTCTNGSALSSLGGFSSFDPCGSGTSANVRVGAVASSGTSLITGQVYSWGTSGLGVVNSTESPSDTGPHAVDSYAGIDALILNFVNKVSLSALSIGWNGTDNATTTGGVAYNDSDMAVYAWTGTAATPTSYLKSTTGWTLVGTYGNVGAQTGNTQNISTAINSSYWLVSALGGSSGTCSSTSVNDKCVDAFKLLTVSGTSYTPPPGVPEPGSLALLGLGAAGLLAARRKAVTRR